MSLVNHLKNIGLEDKEAKVYLAMLELGPSTVLEIAAKAEVTRPTAYVMIESLKKMGLVSTQTRGKKQLFMGESPDQIKVNLDKEEKLIEQRKEELKQILPDLESFFKTSGERPEVRYLEGKEGILSIQTELLKCKERQIYGISSLDAIMRVFPNHDTEYVNRRVQGGIKSKFIYTSSRGAFLKETDELQLRESKYIDPQKMPFEADIVIFDDNVAISSLVGDIGSMILKNDRIAQSMRSLFFLIWNLIG